MAEFQPMPPPVEAGADGRYRRILGVRFFVGNAAEAVKIGARGGLVVVPAAPALVELAHDREYREALLGADLVITDSGFMVLLWNMMTRDRIQRASGLEYLKILLARPEFCAPGAALWVMPSEQSRQRNLDWLKSQGYPISAEDTYVAPKYGSGAIVDAALLNLLRVRQSRHVIIGLGGGVQEKLGLYLRKHGAPGISIHCIGAAIGFLSGDQVRIPDWADKWKLGWLFRCAANPRRFVPRYVKALRLPVALWRYHDRMPELQAVATPARD
jgi:UDP-N-acetyl-D-mannosaminuronic acid transferase (WecB/TagA/CpsF family)